MALDTVLMSYPVRAAISLSSIGRRSSVSPEMKNAFCKPVMAFITAKSVCCRSCNALISVAASSRYGAMASDSLRWRGVMADGSSMAKDSDTASSGKRLGTVTVRRLPSFSTTKSGDTTLTLSVYPGAATAAPGLGLSERICSSAACMASSPSFMREAMRSRCIKANSS